MILQFDVGNTRLKWRLLKNYETVDGGSTGLDEFRMDSLCINERLEAIQLAAVRKGEELDRLMEDVGRAYPALDIYQAEAAARFGSVRFGYEFPEMQGVDRCLAMLAAYKLCSGRDGFRGVMVIDAGSAITVDVLDVEGEQIEGYIIPGLAMMREALLGKTSKISDGYRAAVRGAAALSTRECVDRGVLRAFNAGVRDFIETSQIAGLDLVVTGGDALLMKGLLPSQRCYLVEDLVLDGLALVAAEDMA